MGVQMEEGQLTAVCCRAACVRGQQARIASCHSCTGGPGSLSALLAPRFGDLESPTRYGALPCAGSSRPPSVAACYVVKGKHELITLIHSHPHRLEYSCAEIAYEVIGEGALVRQLRAREGGSDTVLAPTPDFGVHRPGMVGSLRQLLAEYEEAARRRDSGADPQAGKRLYLRQQAVAQAAAVAGVEAEAVGRKRPSGGPVSCGRREGRRGTGARGVCGACGTAAQGVGAQARGARGTARVDPGMLTRPTPGGSQISTHPHRWAARCRPRLPAALPTSCTRRRPTTCWGPCASTSASHCGRSCRTTRARRWVVTPVTHSIPGNA